MEGIELFIIIYGVVSCCFSLCVIGTILFFKKMQRGKFMLIILQMSLTDLGLNITSSWGFLNDGDVLCWIQGLLSGFFTLAGWFWTTMLAYRVYCMIRYGGCTMTMFQMKLIAWGLPAFLALLPLTSADIGNENRSGQWCLYQRRGDYPKWLVPMWSYVAYFMWLFICVGLMLAWQMIISIQFRDSSMKEVIRRTYDKVYLYPVAMIICWTLNLICIDYVSKKSFLNSLSMIFGISNGIMSALIFACKSGEARKRWYQFLFPSTRRREDAPTEPRLDFEFDDDDALLMGESMDYGGGGSVSTPSADLRMSEFSSGSNNPMSPTSTSDP